VSTTDESDLEERRAPVTGATSEPSIAGHAPKSADTNARVQVRKTGGPPTLARIDLRTDRRGPGIDEGQGYAYAEQAEAAYPVSLRPAGARRDSATEGPPNRGVPPRRESDHLLERLRTLVQESRRGSIELGARSHEIEHVRAELADVVKRTAATTTSGREARQ
jgi:hypothetical protein